MEPEILKQIKRKINQRKVKKEHFSKLLEEINKLEEDETVKKYLKLKEELESVDCKKLLGESESQIISSIFYSYQYQIRKTNGIYLCLGTFMLDSICDIEHGPSDIRLKRDDPRAEYRIYRDIENGDSIQLPISKCEEFERTHKVIIPKTTSAERYYYEL